MRTLVLLLLALGALHAGAASAAGTTGAPGSPACGKALETLRELEDRVLAAPRERAEALRRQLLPVRRNAALACLGDSGDDATPRPPRVEATPPLRGPTLPAAPSLQLPGPTPARVAPPTPPRTLGACDANGCWTSDGIRLQRVGPQLLGPSGFCSTAGNSVQCP